jgi:hypothetical protein
VWYTAAAKALTYVDIRKNLRHSSEVITAQKESQK